VTACFRVSLILPETLVLIDAPKLPESQFGENCFYLVILSRPQAPELAKGTKGKSKDPENASLAMLIQGVFLRDCPRKRISRPQFSAKSCQRGFVFSLPMTSEVDSSSNRDYQAPQGLKAMISLNDYRTGRKSLAPGPALPE
jgi:hypothetical protein